MSIHASTKQSPDQLLVEFAKFSIPLLIWLLIELVFLPMDFFTFRVWETLVVSNNKLLSGPFYPNANLNKVEEGELVPHTAFAEKKIVTWYTDNWGYRNRHPNGHQDIVIIGDSFTAGVKLDQDEILPEALSEKLHLNVYGFAPADINKFLVSKRFQADPPEIVILCRIERGLSNLPNVNLNAIKLKVSENSGNIIYKSELLEKLSIYSDRIMKLPSLQFLRSYVQKNDKPLPKRYGEDFFVQGESSCAKKGVPDDDIEKIADLIHEYDKVIKAKNIRFIFAPIPDKETVYYRYFTDQKPDYLPRLIKKCRELGIETIDFHEPFIEANYEYNNRLYFTDDGHWNSDGVDLAAGILAQAISTRDNKKPRMIAKHE